MTVDSGWRALCRYRSEWLGADLLAGVGVAVLAIPSVIAYAELAGLPPQTGLVTSGFVWPPEAVFDPDRVTALFDRLKEQVPGLVRAKAVFNLGQQYVWLNWTAS